MVKAHPPELPGENRLLVALPRKEADRLRPLFKRVSLGLKETLYKADEPIHYVYFPLSGVLSLVIVTGDGGAIEVGMVGKEGFVGTPIFLGADRSPTTAFCQVPGDALRMAADDFRREAVARPGLLQDLIRRYTQAFMNQVSQSVACNHLHSVQERMCRWLLMTHDRVGADQFPLTQEFLAQMLGVRRPSVSVVAQMLQQAGLIEYHRGRMKILNRKGLEEGACECYRVVRREYDRLLGNGEPDRFLGLSKP